MSSQKASHEPPRVHISRRGVAPFDQRQSSRSFVLFGERLDVFLSYQRVSPSTDKQSGSLTGRSMLDR